ncbi:DEAD/DEAH box helicase [Flammeovirga agarivorans]|uniref:DEAD/DEAH box helicase n=1 Tax=Flammeovirga agarivorans TaxID=2726742 RepID=A0A7X8SJ87_9BACT|nr:DEAD/DEAH box helicase [Flammeovirga agarivorans]NLR91147.1 DEAD/DEAH box helicase [Flammeovirga agarivorans]
MSFEEIGINNEDLLEKLYILDYNDPTPIQKESIPVILENRDVLGCAQTGTGKTLAFCLPIIQQLLQEHTTHNKTVSTLILTPTRELATQISENIGRLIHQTPLKQAVIFGGIPADKQIRRLKKGVNIITATPGRLIDLVKKGHIKLSQVKHFVLDEADKMLDMGFVKEIFTIESYLSPTHQTLLFSATMPNKILDVASKLLNQPQEIKVSPVSSTAVAIDEKIYYVDQRNKKRLLIDVIKNNNINNALIFTNTKRGANFIVKALGEAGIKSLAIHGNKSQEARTKALSYFKKKKIDILVATDIAARGIDIDSLDFVINYEIPPAAETYVHRIGRTGRAGKSGQAISIADGTELDSLKNIEKLIKHSIEEVKEHDFPMMEAEQDRNRMIKKKQKNNRRSSRR